MNWISANDKLPPEKALILAYCTFYSGIPWSDYELCVYEDGKLWRYGDSGGIVPHFPVLRYWMLLPEDPGKK